jgi:flagellar biosynthetic protein FliP
MRLRGLLLIVGLSLLTLTLPQEALGQGIPMVNVKGSGGGTQYSLTLQLLALMTALTLLPSLALMMTSFVRIIVVLSLLRQALGTGQTPPNTVLTGLALFLSLFVMQPVLNSVWQDAAVPYIDEKTSATQAIAAAEKPIRAFMLAQTREDDLALFMEISRKREAQAPQEVPFTTLVPAFIIFRTQERLHDRLSDLHTLRRHRSHRLERTDVHGHDDALAHDDRHAVQADAVRALVDGWSLLMGSLAGSFAIP